MLGMAVLQYIILNSTVFVYGEAFYTNVSIAYHRHWHYKCLSQLSLVIY